MEDIKKPPKWALCDLILFIVLKGGVVIGFLYRINVDKILILNKINQKIIIADHILSCLSLIVIKQYDNQNKS